jgi:hypothetical protein
MIKVVGLLTRKPGLMHEQFDETALARAAATPEMKRLTDDGALFIGRIKSYVIEEKQIIPPPRAGGG